MTDQPNSRYRTEIFRILEAEGRAGLSPEQRKVFSEMVSTFADDALAQWAALRRAEEVAKKSGAADVAPRPGSVGSGARVGHNRLMRISVAADEITGVANVVVEELRERGHEVVVHGALQAEERDDWAWASEAAARDVAEGRADQAVVCCWTGTGASIAANKVAGVRAALCVDAYSAEGARKWNDANVLALSLRLTSRAQLGEILDAWFAGAASTDPGDRANIAHVDEIA